MAEEKKMNKGIIAAICGVVIAAIVAVVAVVIINNNKGGLAGTYNLSAIVDSEGNESSVDAASNVMNYTIDLKDDKTGTMVMKVDMSAYSDYAAEGTNLKSEVNSTITYDDSKMKITTNGVEAEANYEFKDGVLTLELNGQKMKFKKA